MKTEGRNAVIELLKTGKNVDKILMEKSNGSPQGSLGIVFAEARKRNVRVQFVEKRVLEKESETGRHQGVIAFTTDYEYFDLDDLIATKKSEKGGFIVLFNTASAAVHCTKVEHGISTGCSVNIT